MNCIVFISARTMNDNGHTARLVKCSLLGRGGEGEGREGGRERGGEGERRGGGRR